jgi:hypothetical protein
MLVEIRQIREELWEESGHNFHKMVQIIEKEAREVMIKYRKFPTKSDKSNMGIPESDSHEVSIKT